VVKSAFVELLVPIIGEGNALPFVQALDLNLSGRYDNYSDFGSTKNPKIAVNWKMTDRRQVPRQLRQVVRGPGLHQHRFGRRHHRRKSASATMARARSTCRSPPMPTPPSCRAARRRRPPAPSARRSPALQISGGNDQLQPQTRQELGDRASTFNPVFLPGFRAGDHLLELQADGRHHRAAGRPSRSTRPA
jgi:iron complex outermembrane receptor protein